MNTDKITYVQTLINEEILKLISEGTGVLNKGKINNIYTDDDDINGEDSFDLDSLWNDDDDQDSEQAQNNPNLRKNVDFSNQPKVGMGRKGDAFQAAKTATDRVMKDFVGKGREIPYGKNGKSAIGDSLDQLIVDPNVKNKANKLNRDNMDPNLFGRIQARCARMQKSDAYKAGPIMIISLYNVDPIDVKNLKLTFEGKGHTEKVNTTQTRTNYGKDAATFIVYEQNIDLWQQEDLPQILNFLKNCVDDKGKPKYGNDQVFQNLDAIIKNRIDAQNPNNIEDYFAKSENNALEMYKQYLESENDEEIQAIINLYNQGGLINLVCANLNLPKSYGHMLSVKNAKAIMFSGRQASFVLPEATWLKVFGRVVNPNAKPFYVRIPNVKNKKGKWKNQGPITIPYVDKDGKNQHATLTNTQDILDTFYGGTRFEDLSPQKQFFVNCLANRDNPAIHDNFFVIPEYDVADTTWDPNLKATDIFNETVGLSSNILNTVQLNTPAQKEFADRQSELDKQEPVDPETLKSDIPELIDARMTDNTERTKAAYENIKAYLDSNNQRIGYNVDRSSLSKTVIGMLQGIAAKLFPEKGGITNPSLYNPLINNVVYFTCLRDKIALDAVKGLKTKQENLTHEDLAQFSVVSDELAKIVEGWAIQQPFSNKVVAEGEETTDVFADKPHDSKLIKKQAAKFLMKLYRDSQRDGLYEMLNRMDASKKNLL